MATDNSTDDGDDFCSDAMIAVGAQVHRDDDCQSDEAIAVKIYQAMRRVRREEIEGA